MSDVLKVGIVMVSDLPFVRMKAACGLILSWSEENFIVFNQLVERKYETKSLIMKRPTVHGRVNIHSDLILHKWF